MINVTDNNRCLPLQGYEILNNSTDYNLAIIPPEVFDICTPTNGSHEVVKAHGKKWLALDIISTASIVNFAFGVDEHPMWVYAVDGNYIEPLKVHMLNVNNGDRFSVLVQLNKTPGDYGIRVASLSPTQAFDTTAILSYGGGHDDHNHGYSTNVSSVSWFTRGGAPISKNVTMFDQAKMVSFPPQFPQPAPEASQTFFLLSGNAGTHPYTYAVNSTPFDHAILDDEAPPFLYQQPNANNPGQNITLTTKNNTWVDLVFVVPQLGQVPHIMHKHANKGFIIGAGEGIFNWTTVAEAAKAIPESFNLVTPPYRDGFATLPTNTKPTWLAVRYQVTNPGVWMVHCHIQDHLRGGMAAIILDGVDAWPAVPDEYKN
jgi:FtsP/CotA-like multicopper oxidase with cupredoxin domain